MKKRIQKLQVYSLLAFASLTSPVLAGPGTNNIVPQLPNPVSFESLEDIINFLGNLVRPIVLITFVAVIMYAGWVRLNAKDDAKKVEASSKIIMAAITGFIIIALAPVAVDFVGRLLGIQGGILDL